MKFADFFFHGMTPVNMTEAQLQDCIKAFHKLEIQLCHRTIQPDLREKPGFIPAVRFPFWPADYDVGVVDDIRYLDLSARDK